MARPVGSPNRERPFNVALRMALRGDPLLLRRIARKLTEKAEEGDLAAIREIADRLDGKPAQAIDRRDVPVEKMSDEELHFLLSAELEADTPKVLLIPPNSKHEA